MQKIEVIQLTIYDLQKMLDLAVENAIKAYQESQKRPSKYEELTLEEAASELHCCPATIRRRMKEIGIDPLRIGKRIFIKRLSLDRIKHGKWNDKVRNTTIGY